MAKLSANGREIGRVYFTTRVKAYFESGKVLENRGFGWKVLCRVTDPKAAYESQLKEQQAFLAPRPHLRNYREALRKMAGIGKAWKLHQAIALMPGDYDGIWSECCDGYGDNVHASVDELRDLCKLFALAEEEARGLTEAKE